MEPVMASSVVSTPSKTLDMSAENAAPPVTATCRPAPSPSVLPTRSRSA